MFSTIYFLLTIVLYIITLPILLILSILRQKYKRSIPARFFLMQNLNFKANIWVHACSLGEINSTTCIINQIPKDKTILLTTITHTGFSQAHKLYSQNDNIKIHYLPFECFLPAIILLCNKFNGSNIEKLIVLEAELWYMMFVSAKLAGAKNILLNARISNKSFPKYQKYSFFYRKLFSKIDEIYTQQQNDIMKFKALGAQNLQTLGNLKIFNIPKVTKKFKRFNAHTIVAASTHKGEEKLIVESYLQNFKDNNDFRLIVVPRHPERFDEVWELMNSYNTSCARFSKVGLDFNYNIILIDAIGELINIYDIASLVILGGSFVNIGGHNPIECAFFHTKLISGPYIGNQESLFSVICGVTFGDSNNLSEILANYHNLPQTQILQYSDKIQKLKQIVN